MPSKPKPAIFRNVANHSPLSELHRENGAHFTEDDGWSLPLHFGKPLEEYQSVRSRAGLFDLCHRSLLRFTGPDRVSFLQGMVSNDIEKLTPGQGTAAAVLDIHGKILADIRILCAEDYLLLDLWESLKEKIVNHFNRYLIADEVEISDLTDQYGILSVQGPSSRELLEELLGTDKLPSTDLSHAEYQTGDGKARLVRATHTGEEGFDIFLEIKDLLQIVSSIQEKGKTLSTQWVGCQIQEVLRIEAGIPRYGVDMDEANILLETGLDRAVSFQKGCYLGQEVIERIHSRGHVNRKLIGMVLEGDSAAMRADAIHAEEHQVGNVTSSVISPALKCSLALGYVHRDFTSPGTRVVIHRNGNTIPATVSSLPFHESAYD